MGSCKGPSRWEEQHRQSWDIRAPTALLKSEVRWCGLNTEPGGGREKWSLAPGITPNLSLCLSPGPIQSTLNQAARIQNAPLVYEPRSPLCSNASDGSSFFQSKSLRPYNDLKRSCTTSFPGGTAFLPADSAPTTWPPFCFLKDQAHSHLWVFALSLEWPPPLQISSSLTSSLHPKPFSNVTFSMTAILSPYLKFQAAHYSISSNSPQLFLLFLLP